MMSESVKEGEKEGEKPKKNIAIDQFNVITVDLMIELYKNEALSNKVIDYIHKLNLWYYTILEKIRLLEAEASVDPKTGLLKHSDRYLENLLKIASRAMEHLEKGFYHITYIRIDIDDFSDFNNKYGHGIGDIVLKEIANRIRKYTRPTDYCVRYGGEEFDIWLPNTDVKGAKGFADKFYKAIRGLNVEVEAKKVNITVSMGLTLLKVGFGDLQKIHPVQVVKWYKNLQQEVDDALYKAKYMGKNRYYMYNVNEKDDYKRYREEYVSQGKKRKKAQR